MILELNEYINDVIKSCNLSLSIKNVIINRTTLTKYLGVWIDDMLNWKPHIDSMVKKNANFIGMIYKKRSLIPYACCKNLYFSLIYSRVIYGIEVFGSANKSVLTPLLISCNRVLKALQEKPRHYPVSRLYFNFHTLSVFDLFKFFILNLVYRSNNMKSSLPSVINSMFLLNASVHNYNTRSISLIHMNHNFSFFLGSSIYLA